VLSLSSFFLFLSDGYVLESQQVQLEFPSRLEPFPTFTFKEGSNFYITIKMTTLEEVPNDYVSHKRNRSSLVHHLNHQHKNDPNWTVLNARSFGEDISKFDTSQQKTVQRGVPLVDTKFTTFKKIFDNKAQMKVEVILFLGNTTYNFSNGGNLVSLPFNDSSLLVHMKVENWPFKNCSNRLMLRGTALSNGAPLSVGYSFYPYSRNLQHVMFSDGPQHLVTRIPNTIALSHEEKHSDGMIDTKINVKSLNPLYGTIKIYTPSFSQHFDCPPSANCSTFCDRNNEIDFYFYLTLKPKDRTPTPMTMTYTLLFLLLLIVGSMVGLVVLLCKASPPLPTDIEKGEEQHTSNLKKGVNQTQSTNVGKKQRKNIFDGIGSDDEQQKRPPRKNIFDATNLNHTSRKFV